MKDPIITHSSIKDRIQLEEKYNFLANLTIGLVKGNDFYVKIEFTNLTLEDYETLLKLSKLQKELKLESELINKEEYNITHIVLTGFSANNMLEMTWECLSDNPNFSLTID